MKLLFVYNADASLFASALDFIHKTVSSGTYQCNLCHLTYGATTVKKEWKRFIESLGHEKTFLHRDEFRKNYPQYADSKLPAVFNKTSGALELLVSADEINQAKNLEDLKTLVSSKLKHASQ